MSQLALPLTLQDHAVFDSFLAAGNEALVAALCRLATGRDGPGGFLWGAPASGKTHLLQAVCAATGDRSAYLPLADMRKANPSVLQGLHTRTFICLDDVHAVAGLPAWELALFGLLNLSIDSGSHIVASAGAAPRQCGIVLADLESRLSQLPVFHVHSLAEADRIRALQLRARHRGLELPDDTAAYLLARSKRDMRSLYGLLDRLDSESLAAQRRLTIPFVRDVLATL